MSKKIYGATVATPINPNKMGSASDEQIASALESYLEEHPIEGGSGGGFVASDTPPEDTSLLWVDTSDNSGDEGGSATMQPLTFTGAVNATYDGSQAVNVEIPQGGGGGTGGNTYWKKIAEVEVTEADVSNVYITQDIDGNPLNIDKSHRWQVYTSNANYSANGYVDLQLNKFMMSGTTSSVALRLNTYTGSDFFWFGVEPFLEGQLFVKGVIGTHASRNIRQGSEIPTFPYCYDSENITRIGVNLKSGTYFTAGTIISVYEEVSA